MRYMKVMRNMYINMRCTSCMKVLRKDAYIGA